ncbi:MAG: hypothetical protein LBQ64_03585 [Bacteroidales bacterium]|jgi:hypothetical protein|nr:hypothetical protein [Bacteroidales bacterium]
MTNTQKAVRLLSKSSIPFDEKQYCFWVKAVLLFTLFRLAFFVEQGMKEMEHINSVCASVWIGLASGFLLPVWGLQIASVLALCIGFLCEKSAKSKTKASLCALVHLFTRIF